MRIIIDSITTLKSLSSNFFYHLSLSISLFISHHFFFAFFSHQQINNLQHFLLMKFAVHFICIYVIRYHVLVKMIISGKIHRDLDEIFTKIHWRNYTQNSAEYVNWLIFRYRIIFFAYKSKSFAMSFYHWESEKLCSITIFIDTCHFL